MKIKVVTLNAWMFHFYDKIHDFLIDQNPDVILLQEVISGTSEQTIHGPANSYELLRTSLDAYQSTFVPFRKYLSNDLIVWMGTSIFSKFDIKSSFSNYYLDSFEIIKMSDDDALGQGHTNFPGLLVGIEVYVDNKILNLLSTHFIWSKHPEINDRQRQAIKNLTNYLKVMDNFIIGGDFNCTDDSEIYTTLSSYLHDDRPKDLVTTLHPEIHKLKGSKNLAVDYLFHKGNSIQLLNSIVPDVAISDHLPVIAEYQIT